MHVFSVPVDHVGRVLLLLRYLLQLDVYLLLLLLLLLLLRFTLLIVELIEEA